MTTVFAFDFNAKTITSPPPDRIQAVIDAGDYCWIDMDQTSDAAAILDALDVGPDTIERIAKDLNQGQFIMAQNCIHFTVLETQLDGNILCLNTLHVVVGNGYLATIHINPRPCWPTSRKLTWKIFRLMLSPAASCCSRSQII